MTKIINLFAGLFLINIQVLGQFQQGLRLGKYTNLYQMMLNPAATPEGNAFNIIQGGVFANGNIIGVARTNTFAFIPRKNGLVIQFPRGKLEYPLSSAGSTLDTVLGYFQDTLNNHFLYGSFVYEGPSAVIAVNESSSIGLAFRIKGNLGAFQIPDGIIPFTYKSQPFFSTYPISPFNLSGAVYAEIPLTYSFKKRVGYHVLSVGTALKFILPMTSTFLNSRNTLQISQRPLNNFNLSNVEGDMGFSVWSRNPINGRIRKSINGFGMGLDIGGRLTEGEGRWYIGASMIDVGYVGFKRNSLTFGIASSGVSSHNGNTYISALFNGNVIQVGNSFSTDILGSALAGQTGSVFQMLLPASFNFQGGISLGNSLFISTMANIPLLKPIKNIQSIETFMVMPSWESGIWAVKVPLSLSVRQLFTPGLALRIGPFTLGSDNIKSWVGNSNFTGTDVYFALQLLFNYHPNNQSKGSGKKNNNFFRCYTF